MRGVFSEDQTRERLEICYDGDDVPFVICITVAMRSTMICRNVQLKQFLPLLRGQICRTTLASRHTEDEGVAQASYGLVMKNPKVTCARSYKTMARVRTTIRSTHRLDILTIVT